jgi:hypothetical protein
MMGKYWWDFIHEPHIHIVVQSMKNPCIAKFTAEEEGQQAAELLIKALTEGRVRLTAKDEIKE